jgi:hypothetical protein
VRTASETSVYPYETIRRCNPEGSHLCTRHRGNLKPHAVVDFSAAMKLKPHVFTSRVTINVGRAMAEEVSCRPLTSAASVRAQVSPRGICGGQTYVRLNTLKPQYKWITVTVGEQAETLCGKSRHVNGVYSDDCYSVLQRSSYRRLGI